MKSRTSFFNRTVFQKNLIRFAPVWVLYTVFLLLYLFAISRTHSSTFAKVMTSTMGGFAWINLAYAGICAFCLFGDLFNSRLCNALHAFPMRREGWLLTGAVSGILFALIPNFLITLLAGAIMWEYAYIAFIWLGAVMLQFLFFFGTAVLSALCAGNRLAMIAIYGIIHFITLLMYGVFALFYQPLLYGFYLDVDAVYKFFPLNHLSGYAYVNLEHDYVADKLRYEGLQSSTWQYLGLCAGAGMLCLVLAWLVYRKRKLETAGDFISLRPLAPVFLTIVSVGAGALLYLFSELFGGQSYLFLAFGLAIGYFAGSMLLKRTLRVFYKKALLGFVVLITVFAGSIFLTSLDPMGIASYIPHIDDVEWVAMYDGSNRYPFMESITSDKRIAFTITEEQEIIAVQDFNQLIIDSGRPKNADRYGALYVTYQLKSGRQITRIYEIAADSAVQKQAKMFFSDMRYLFHVQDPSVLYQRFWDVTIESYGGKDDLEPFNIKDQATIAGLLDAIAADCQAGVMAQSWAFREGEILFGANLACRKNSGSVYESGWEMWFDLRITDQCANTLAYIKQVVANQ